METSASGTIKKTMIEKLRDNKPYNLFFTAIPDSSQTHQQINSITFANLLCPSLGELKCSLQINFLLDLRWLIKQYENAGQVTKPLTVLYGDTPREMERYCLSENYRNVEQYQVKMKMLFGTHHSKVGIYVYTDNSLRVVISTANLFEKDWTYYNQGLWISPRCPALSPENPDTSGESITQFKSALLTYLQQYGISILSKWIDYVKRADFSSVRVFFVSSVPGNHVLNNNPNGDNLSQCHLLRVGELLSAHCQLPFRETEGEIIAQASSIGSLKDTPKHWLCGPFLSSLASHVNCQFPSESNLKINLVYPTKSDVLTSYYGINGGECLSYSKSNYEKQCWIKDYLHSWKAERTGRSKIIPHIKTYCHISPCHTKLAWLLLTSANISQAAWGAKPNKKNSSHVLSYEAGVLFLPKYFDEEYFNIQIKDENNVGRSFPFMYDLPLKKYEDNDEPWCN